jgi:hypothetical membrane protein
MLRVQATGPTWLLLRLGVLVPFVYYGVQAAAAPFFPGFSFVGTTASEMGATLSRHPVIFNAGIIALGVIMLLASAGFWLGLRRVGVGPPLALLSAAYVALGGVQLIWAALHPLPDPRHAGYTLLVAGMFCLPVLIALSLWRGASPALRAYFAATLLLLAAMVPVVTGHAGIDRWANRGLIQRLYTVAIYPRVGGGAWAVGWRVRTEDQ